MCDAVKRVLLLCTINKPPCNKDCLCGDTYEQAIANCPADNMAGKELFKVVSISPHLTCAIMPTPKPVNFIHYGETVEDRGKDNSPSRDYLLAGLENKGFQSFFLAIFVIRQYSFFKLSITRDIL